MFSLRPSFPAFSASTLLLAFILPLVFSSAVQAQGDPEDRNQGSASTASATEESQAGALTDDAADFLDQKDTEIERQRAKRTSQQDLEESETLEENETDAPFDENAGMTASEEVFAIAGTAALIAGSATALSAVASGLYIIGMGASVMAAASCCGTTPAQSEAAMMAMLATPLVLGLLALLSGVTAGLTLYIADASGLAVLTATVTTTIGFLVVLPPATIFALMALANIATMAKLPLTGASILLGTGAVVVTSAILTGGMVASMAALAAGGSTLLDQAMFDDGDE